MAKMKISAFVATFGGVYAFADTAERKNALAYHGNARIHGKVRGWYIILFNHTFNKLF